MSIDAIRPRETHYRDEPETHGAQSTDQEPDFSSSVYSTVHLPTGLIAASTKPTLATVTKDLAELRAHVAAVSADLSSPELQTALKADARVYGAYVFFNACFLPLAKAVYIDQGPAKSGGGAIALVALWKGIPAAINDLKAAHARSVDANAKAHPAFMKLMHDLAAMQEAGIKLAADTARLGGVP